MTWRKLLGKVVVVTRMRKIPKGCIFCPFYDSMGGTPGRHNDGICTALRNRSTSSVKISKERLPDCPLQIVEKGI